MSWLDHRTGIETAIRNFLYEEIPASSGWHQVFGSIAVFLFLVQAFTGALLAFRESHLAWRPFGVELLARKLRELPGSPGGQST